MPGANNARGRSGHPGDKIFQDILEKYHASGLFTHAFAAYGTLLEHQDDPRALARIENDGRSIYDLSSLTKTLATSTLIYRSIQKGDCTLKTKLGDILGSEWTDLKGAMRNLTIAEVLEHVSGLPFWTNFYVGCEKVLPFPIPVAQRRQHIINVLNRREVSSKKEHIYSDLGFILLGEVISKLNSDKPLKAVFNEFCDEVTTQETHEGFLNFQPETKILNRVVATAFCPLRKQELIGEVHDENCAILGGATGHAGLFGSGIGVIDYLKGFWNSDVGGVWKKEILARLSKESEKATHILGWDRLTSNPSREFGNGQALGHLGFTGGMFWVDLKSSQYVILLTNRVMSGRITPAIKDMRQEIVRAAATYCFPSK